MRCSCCGANVNRKDCICDYCGNYQGNGNQKTNVGEIFQNVTDEIKNNKSISNAIDNLKGKSEHKSRIVAFLLALLFGVFGVHDFYLGFSSRGVIKICLTFFGSFILIGPIISEIWSLVDAFNCLFTKNKKDGYGNLLI